MNRQSLELMAEFIRRTDFNLLHAQKDYLMTVMEANSNEVFEKNFGGILGFIDNFQDMAEKIVGEDTVFDKPRLHQKIQQKLAYTIKCDQCNKIHCELSESRDDAMQKLWNAQWRVDSDGRIVCDECI